MKYYAVTCKQGHHGVKKYYPITFAIEAGNILEACEIAKTKPGVKHGQTVLRCEEISYEIYVELCKTSAYERNYDVRDIIDPTKKHTCSVSKEKI